MEAQVLPEPENLPGAEKTTYGGDEAAFYTHPLRERKGNCCFGIGQLLFALQRIFISKFPYIEVEPWEIEALQDSGVDVVENPVAARYAVLRESALSACLYFTFTSVVISMFQLVDKVNGLQRESEADGKYRETAELAYAVEIGRLVFITTPLIAAFLLAWTAKHVWTKVARSRTLIRLSFLLMYAPPFVAYLLVNPVSYIDYGSIIRKACNEFLFEGGSESLSSFFDIIEELSKPVDGAMYEALKIPKDFCNKPIREWEHIFNETIRKSGFVSLGDGKADCPRASGFVNTVLGGSQMATEVAALCAPGAACSECTDCTGVYSYYLSCQALSKVNPLAMTTCEASAPTLKDCVPCFQEFEVSADVQMNCADVCIASDATRASHFVQSMSQFGGGDLIGSSISMCLKQTEVNTMLSALKAIRFLQFSAQLTGGLVQAAECIVALLPLAIAQIMGVQRGLIIAKILVPELRLPGVLLGASIIFSAPFLLSILAVIQVTIGNYMLSLAFVVVVAILFIMLPIGDFKKSEGDDGSEGILGAQSEESAAVEFDCRKRVQKALWLLAAVFIGLWAYVSDLVAPLLDSITPEMREQLLDIVLWQAVINGVQFLLSIFGKSLIAFVFFLDGAVHFMASEYAGRLKDDQDERVYKNRERRLRELCALTGQCLQKGGKE